VDYGLTVVERVAVEVPPREANRKFLDTKRSIKSTLKVH